MEEHQVNFLLFNLNICEERMYSNEQKFLAEKFIHQKMLKFEYECEFFMRLGSYEEILLFSAINFNRNILSIETFNT